MPFPTNVGAFRNAPVRVALNPVAGFPVAEETAAIGSFEDIPVRVALNPGARLL